MNWDVRHGDALSILRKIPDESINSCISSPPYWGLRDYQTGSWSGGDAACGHVKEQIRMGRGLPALGEQYRGGGHKAAKIDDIHFSQVCGKCGALRVDLQIGLEETPDLYIQHLVEVFREVRRVLRTDGTCWVNIGDSYAGSWGNQRRKEERGNQREINGPMIQPVHDGRYADKKTNTGKIPDGSGLKPKDLIGIPWMLAFALRADGWHLRQDIIWSKPNPMPESVGDRCTKSHEYIFLLAKNARYWYDNEAIFEPLAQPRSNANEKPRVLPPSYKGSSFSSGKTKTAVEQTGATVGDGARIEAAGRNKRSVWSIPTCPYPEAHFATFPPALVEPCVLAGCPSGGVVLDPFSGSGTTGIVSLRHGRRYIGIELSADYVKLSRKRLDEDHVLSKYHHCSVCGLPLTSPEPCCTGVVRWA